MELDELLELVLNQRQRELHTAMPGRVESYDAATQTCDVLPQLKIQRPDGEGGYKVCDLPVLPHVPVCFPRAGDMAITLPIEKGDFVLVVFSERAIGNWRQKGEASTPGDLRMHSLAGAVAIPGVYPSGSALSDASTTDMVIGKHGTASAQIVITPTEVKLGGGAQYVALANKVATELGKIATAFTKLTSPSGAVTFLTPADAYSAGSVAAANVKAT